jgi:predicted dehydrogenase
MIGIGVIGYGYWGPNLVRNFAEQRNGRVTFVADTRPERLAQASARYPAIKTSTNYRDLIADPAVDAVVIATPVSSHAPLALEALRAGKHVLVEKPLASTVDDASRLTDEAASRGLTLMVDHTFVYTAAVRKMRDLVVSGDAGQVYYYDSVRINLGLFQRDVNVLWDLAVHDLSIMDHVLGACPVAVSAVAMSHVPGEPENIAYMTMFFDDRLIAHLHVNWLSPVKVRRTILGASKKMILFDDLETSEKIKVYDRGISVNPSAENVYQMLVGYRAGDMWSPQLGVTEALHTEAAHFLDCVEHRRRPETDGEAGLRVVRLLEAATASIAQQGRPISVSAKAPVG